MVQSVTHTIDHQLAVPCWVAVGHLFHSDHPHHQCMMLGMIICKFGEEQ